MHPSELERWRKRLDKEGSQPAYRLVAELIAEDIDSGRLQPRERLPPLRELAGGLRINYTTAARAYNEAKLRGLIDSHPGSGTFVKGRALSVKPSSGYEMTMNLMIEPAIPTLIERVRDSAISVLAQRDLYSLLRYQAFGGSHHDRVAALQWLDRRLENTTLEQVLICPGIHSALVGLLMQLAAPGQLICVESLVYPGLKAIAAQLGLTLHSLERDSDGPLVRPFEEICKQGQVAVLYINPTIQNPTTTTISLGRREALADVALRYSIPIIEDDAYTMLSEEKIVPIADLAPELTYYVTGTAKCFGPGLRSAFLHAPTKRQAQRSAGALRATSVMSSPLIDALVSEWIIDGTADAMLKAIRNEAIARLALAEKILGRQRIDSAKGAFHLWLKLPKHSNWNPSELAVQLRSHGVSAVASAAFSTDNHPPEALRLCFGGQLTRDGWEERLHYVADIIDQPAYLSSLTM
ncbi:PLP-dependent aminotransferase family protein [Halomonas campaniensis]|jgi:DNA-binding transcriptional MocR family regulator|uniref:GntR family transcriptional regulator n=1 Tax=Halomonas campaniensis TaxID=213554 RepID=A0A246S258_9GAMM|nr:PLP-dependent aminotransferase family protein [Halomonas campaniensis]OWV30277.1 GntR family transcriptional regulator [Halomonas campaniensis]